LFEESYAAQRAGQLARQDPRDRLNAQRLRRQRRRRWCRPIAGTRVGGAIGVTLFVVPTLSEITAADGLVWTISKRLG
jgi:hypothetical protein